ncbi:MAG: GNAT family N-acetyltransferase [Paludibacteraceae bacterium]|nr:GNAT family N-acetyltransferase [Paludibacteraceae bacterium]
MSNLVLNGYGITLSRLTEDKIETVRKWRNSEKIRQFMVYQKEITQEQQKQWFAKINNDNNYYFIIEIKGKEIGLINLKDIDKGEGESGIFIYDDDYLNTDVSYRAHILMFDFIFNELNHTSIRAEILLTNVRAIRFTNFLGLKEIARNETMGFFKISKEAYLTNPNRLRFLKKEQFLAEKNKNLRI